MIDEQKILDGYDEVVAICAERDALPKWSFRKREQLTRLAERKLTAINIEARYLELRAKW